MIRKTAKNDAICSCRLPAGKSLFYFKGGKATCHDNVPRYCTCIKDNDEKYDVDCSKTVASKPKFPTNNWKELKPPIETHCSRRRRRSTDSSIILPDNSGTGDYLYDPVPLNISIPTWPTATGKTKAAVETHCTQSIMKSGSGKICQELDDFTFAPFISQCVEDIKVNLSFIFQDRAANVNS